MENLEELKRKHYFSRESVYVPKPKRVTLFFIDGKWIEIL